MKICLYQDILTIEVNIIEDFEISEIEKAIRLFKEKNINSFAVVTKFSTRNPKFERNIKEILEKRLFLLLLWDILCQEN